MLSKNNSISLSAINMSKVYKNGIQAVFNFNIDVKDGEFIAIVGPSGCGKSTTLRMFAGLEDISLGELWINGKEVSSLHPKERNVAMVFQSYALYPHFSVYQNIAFGLNRAKEFSKEKIMEKVQKAAKTLELTDYLNRKPKELSGGQRQRVALARAIVKEPSVFLMDEPLSNLDAKLRTSTRTELKKLHKAIKATTIYVTHDQVEALTMADRIVVMDNGFIMQVGSPQDVFLNPSNKFVASFIGSPGMNFIDGTIKNGIFEGEGFKFKVPASQMKKVGNINFGKITLGVRPENIGIEDSLVAKAHPKSQSKVDVVISEPLGDRYIVTSQTNNSSVFKFYIDNYNLEKVQDSIEVYLNLNKIIFFDYETGISLTSLMNDETKFAMEVYRNGKKAREHKDKLIKKHSSKKKWKFKSLIKKNKVLKEEEKFKNQGV